MVVLLTFYNHYVKLPPAEQTPPEIWNDPKLYPFFKDCWGAIDGTHIEAFVPDDTMACYQNCKGFLSQNVLVACAFDMCFCYVLPGGREVPRMGMYLMMHANTVLPFHLGHSFWQMLDFQHVQVSLSLSPTHTIISRSGPEHWKGLCIYWYYMLIVFSRPRNAQELFNLHHVKAHNVIERIFGVVKWWFCLMVAASEYSLETQSKIIHPIFILHNFIHIHDPDEDLGVLDPKLLWQIPRRSTMDFGGSVSPAERNSANMRRDDIAWCMWTQYQEYVACVDDTGQ